MGSWEDNILGISVDDSYKGVKSQLLNCFVMKPYHYGLGTELFDSSINSEDMILGQIDRLEEIPDMEKLFSLCNRLFGNTHVCYVTQGSESNYGIQWYYECVYQASNMTKYTRDASDGAGGLAYADMFYEEDSELDFDLEFFDLQDSCLEYASKRNIDIDWYSLYKFLGWRIDINIQEKELEEIIKKLGLEEELLNGNKENSDYIGTFLYLKYEKEFESVVESMGVDYWWVPIFDDKYYSSDWIEEFLSDVRTAPNGNKIADIFEEVYYELLDKKNTPDPAVDPYTYDRKSTDSVIFVDLDKEYISNIMDKSIQLGYTELTALILEKCKDNILGTDIDSLSHDDD